MRLFKQGMAFKCIGNKCIDSCCKGWDITFDQETFETLSQDSDFKKTMDDYASINDHVTHPDINYGIVSLTEDERCPFLDGDDLCLIQKRSGEDALSCVCALYPRYYNRVDGVYEESLSLACIEATEQLLFGDPLEIIEIEWGPKRDVVFKNVTTQADDNGSSGLGMLYELRHLIFGHLSSEVKPFDEKLGQLLAFHKHIEGMDEAKLKMALESYDFSSKKTTTIDIDENTFRKLITFLERVGSSGHVALDGLIGACVKDARYDTLNLKKLSSIDRVMSNYLIHQMFKDLYPFNPMLSKLGSFETLLKKVQILRVLIAYDGHFDDQSVARMIQMFSKGLDHHAGFHGQLEALIL